MLQKSPAARELSSLQAEMSKLTARLTIAEANLAELMDNPVPIGDSIARAWARSAMAIAVIAVVVAAALTITRLHL